MVTCDSRELDSEPNALLMLPNLVPLPRNDRAPVRVLLM